MTRNLVVLILSLAAFAARTSGVDQMDEKCTITVGMGITVDSCDASKFLHCKSSRCECLDTSSQVYTFRTESESKRSKRGLGKKVAIGAGGAFLGYELAKVSSSGSAPREHKSESSSKKKIFSCYGRVGTQCVLDYNNVQIIANITTPVSNNSDHNNNEGATTVPTTNSTTVAVDLKKIPKCVSNAICRPYDSGNNSTTIHTTTRDPRIGLCTCNTGFRRTTTDLCEKSGTNLLLATSYSIGISVSILIYSTTIFY